MHRKGAGQGWAEKGQDSLMQDVKIKSLAVFLYGEMDFFCFGDDGGGGMKRELESFFRWLTCLLDDDDEDADAGLKDEIEDAGGTILWYIIRDC